MNAYTIKPFPLDQNDGIKNSAVVMSVVVKRTDYIFKTSVRSRALIMYNVLVTFTRGTSPKSNQSLTSSSDVNIAWKA